MSAPTVQPEPNRKAERCWSGVIFWAAIVFAVFQLAAPVFIPFYDLQLRSLHVLAALSVIFLGMPFRQPTRFRMGMVVAALVWVIILAVANLNIFIHWFDAQTYPGEASFFDLVLGLLLIAAVLEAARRATGWAIPICVVFMFGYIFMGRFMPGMWSHPGFPPEYVLGSVYYSAMGIYGGITGTSATFIAMFLIFGAMLGATGGGKTFMDLALLIAGRYRGGPAKVAVVASALFGSISGSTVANTSVTGNYTIPLMVRLGYNPNFAGGVEAMASTGGGFTPPIMGISAFIMSELTGIPYLKIVGYALIPCLLFYAGVMSGIHFEALRLNLPPVPPEDKPDRKEVLTWSRLAPLFLPLAVLLISLYRGATLTKSGFYASIFLLLLFLFSDLSWTGIKDRFSQALKALAAGGKSAALIVPILVAVNIFTHLLGLTGVAPKISGLILLLGGENMIGALLVAALVPFILGTALPTSATYILSVALIAPAILKLGTDVVAVHMFLIYWATLAAVTPPTCTGCIIAANIGGGNWIKVSMVGMRLGVVAFLIPFFFVLEPALVGRDVYTRVGMHTATALLGSILLAAGFFGFFRKRLNILQRVTSLAVGFLFLYPNQQYFLVGLACGGLVIMSDLLIRRNLLRSTP